MKRPSTHGGFGVIEVLIAATVISISFVSLFFVFVMGQRTARLANETVRANFLAEEGIEVMRFLRDQSWNQNFAGLSAGTNYYLSFSTTTFSWSIGTANPGLIDGTFNRIITIVSVGRDANDDIISSNGTIDPDTRKVLSTVTWGIVSPARTVFAETYLTDIFDN